MAADLLDLLQLADSAFPSGSYAHSGGLECLYTRGDVDLECYARLRLAQGLARCELPLVRLAFDAPDTTALRDLDGLADALLPVREARRASRSIGLSFLRSAVAIRPSPGARAALAAGIQHQPVIYGLVVREWGIAREDGLSAYAWQAVRQPFTAAIRLGKIGQSAAQVMLDALKPPLRRAVAESLRIDRDEIGAYTPWVDLAGMGHERQFARLFQS